MRFDRLHLIFGLVLTVTASALAQGEDPANLARELDRAANKTLREASGSQDAFTPAAQKFVESLDEFAADARKYAERPDPARRDERALERLGKMGDHVSNALTDANMPPDIARLWNDTRTVLTDLRGKAADTGPSRAESAYGKAGAEEAPQSAPNPARDLQAAGAGLHRAADALEQAVGELRDVTPADREALLFKARHISENAQTVADLAETLPAKDPRLAKALEKVGFHADRLDDGVAKLADPFPLRSAHEAFFAAYDNAKAALEAARAVKPAAPKKKPVQRRKVKAGKAR